MDVVPIGRPIFEFRVSDSRFPIRRIVVCGPFLQSIFCLCPLSFVLRRLAAREGEEAVQFFGNVALTRVGRHVEQTVAGHDAVAAPATNPVKSLALFGFEIQEFNAPPRSQQITLRGFIAVTAMMVHFVESRLGREFTSDLTACQIDSDQVKTVGRVTPDQTVNHKDVRRTVRCPVTALVTPEQLTAVSL